MELLGVGGHVESRSSPFGDRFMSVQDNCTVCAKDTMGSKIVLDAPDGTPR
jgi:hypothetical protein